MDLNKQYGALCAELGDLVCNKEKIEKRIQDIKAEIDVLNRMAALKAKSATEKEPKSEG